MNRAHSLQLSLGFFLSACSSTVTGSYERDGGLIPPAGGVPMAVVEDVTLADLGTSDRMEPFDGSETSDHPVAMDGTSHPHVFLFIQHLALPHTVLPSGGHHLPVLRWGLHASGGDVRVPRLFFHVEALSGQLTNQQGMDQFTAVQWRDLDSDNNLVAQLERVHVARTDDRQSVPQAMDGSMVIHNDEMTVFSITVDTAHDALAFRDETASPLRYRVTLGNGEEFVAANVIRALNGQEIVVASNQSLSQTVTILPVGHPMVQPMPCNQTFQPGQQAYLCGRMYSSGAPLTLKRLMLSYNADQPVRSRGWHWAGDWEFEWNNEMLTSDWMEMQPANETNTDQAGQISIRFRHEVLLDETSVPFTVYRRAEGRMETGEWLSVSMLTGSELGDRPIARMSAMDQQSFGGWVGPNLWVHPTEACRALPLCTGFSCRDFTDRVQIGWCVWSPLQDGQHSDEPCGVRDWYGNFPGAPLRNVVTVP